VISAPQSILARVPMACVHDPEVAARLEMDDEKLLELAASIRANGLIQPIVLKPKTATDLELLTMRIDRGDSPVDLLGIQFEVIAGHRRTCAHRINNAREIEAKIVLDPTISPEAWKLHENLEREDLNAAEEAVYFDHLLKTIADNDTERLAEQLKKSREYVEGRLLLLRGDEAIFEAIRTRKITYSVGRELNGITSASYRLMYLDAALKGGCSTAQAKRWRLEANQLAEYNPEHAPSGAPESTGPGAGSSYSPECICCRRTENPYEMQLVHLHTYCRKAILEPLLDGGRG
jgi:ParB family transcriptional regulator, chromosome partitioning protein